MPRKFCDLPAMKVSAHPTRLHRIRSNFWLFWRLGYESLIFALGAIKENVLRTVLSLLGVTIGIFAIIAVFTLVDSLETSIRGSLNFLGDKVLYVDKWPWSFGGEYPWWKYINRPKTSVKDFRFLEGRLKNASAVALFGNRTVRSIKRGPNSLDGGSVQGVTYQYNYVSDVNIEQGRYFLPQEIDAGRRVVILGHDVAQVLFPNGENPIGQEISIRRQKFYVIATLVRQGQNILGTPSFDNVCLIPLPQFTRMFDVKISQGGPGLTLAVKGFPEDEGLKILEEEVRGHMRAIRGLKPREEDNFAINRPEQVAGVITDIFKVISLAGAIIGSFSILVGGFGIANIMFVSVKERTNIIGIQKSLGARNYFILFQFLFEAMFLSLFGGLLGLVLVYGLTLIPQDTLEIVLSPANIGLGLGVSAIIGILSGIVPAMVAAALDPVEAIRSK